MHWTTLHQLSSDLPDDRLADVEIRPSGLLVFTYREGFASADFVRDLDELSRHLSRGNLLSLDPDGAPGQPTLDTWVELTQVDLFALAPFRLRPRVTSSGLTLELVTNQNFVRKELADEYNTEVLPKCMAVLRVQKPEKGSGGP